MATIDDSLLAEFAVPGELLRPGDRGYDQARRVHNGMIDKRPGLIVRCRAVRDVAAAVDFGRSQGFELSVRGGGHNVAGTAVTDGGVMVDLSLMRGVDVDPITRRARVEGGATWADVDRATQAHGLAVTGGMISSTGVAGLTLGGGLGWLMCKYGLTADNLVSAEVVTADGRELTASADENEHLFWGLRGGGGNLGIVTRFEYELHEVGPTVTGIGIAYPFAKAVDVLRAYRAVMADAPDELTLNAGLRHASEDSDTKLAGVIGCHLGGAERARHDLRQLLEIGEPVEVEIGPTRYTTINSVLDGAYPMGALNYWKSSFLRDLSDEAIDTMVEQFATCPSTMTVFVIEHLHGALTRVPVQATAVPLREAGYNFLITSVWRDAAASAENIEWTRTAFAAMEPFTARRRYSNYIAADEVGEDPVREAFGPNYERLVELKTRYDPTNLFQLNQNIRPRV